MDALSWAAASMWRAFGARWPDDTSFFALLFGVFDDVTGSTLSGGGFAGSSRFVGN